MIGRIAWKNILHKPLNSILCVSLLVFGVAIISLLILIQHQFEEKLERNLKDTDLVVGAKGSPLQLVLSAVYHLDAPTGNIKLADARQIMENPMVAEAIPLAYGDSYRGYRILGTTEAYMEKYDAVIKSGRVFAQPMETTIGAQIAEKTGLKVGDVFVGTHGEVNGGGDVHEDHPYTVVGILERSNTILDQLVLTSVESVWGVHDHGGHDHGEHSDHGHEHEEHEHEGHSDHGHEHGEHADHEGHSDHGHEHGEHAENDHEGHGHEHSENNNLSGSVYLESTPGDQDLYLGENDNMEITAVLIRYKSKRVVYSMPRTINEQTNMQAVIPSLEINRLFYMLGLGATTLKLIAGGIMLMAGFSVFFVLYNRMRERKYELALMRSVGYRPSDLFGLLILEGLILAALGYALGWILSRAGMYIINRQTESDFNQQFDMGYVGGEFWLLIITFLVGMIAAFLPAWQAMRMDVSKTLSEN
ncbi:MAG: FtsX-like permease family protein [Bacteroidota bacterium]